MANHGLCKNCWWYLPNKLDGYKIDNGKIVKVIGCGFCYMHNGDEHRYKEVNGDEYCPDYINREANNKRTHQTLQDWFKNAPNKSWFF